MIIQILPAALLGSMVIVTTAAWPANTTAMPFDESTIPAVLHGDWTPDGASCEDRIERLNITGDRLEWYESHGYLQLGYSTGKGLLGRFVGKNADDPGVFWESTLLLEPTRAGGMAVSRRDEDGKTISRIEYRRCAGPGAPGIAGKEQ